MGSSALKYRLGLTLGHEVRLGVYLLTKTDSHRWAAVQWRGWALSGGGGRGRKARGREGGRQRGREAGRDEERE